METAILVLLIIIAVMTAVCMVKILMGRNNSGFARLRDIIIGELRENRKETVQSVTNSFTNLGNVINSAQQRDTDIQDRRLKELRESIYKSQEDLQKSVNASLGRMEERMNGFSVQNEQKLENIRQSVENRLSSLQEDNNKKLEAMRETVDEKLQKSLNESLSQSFGLVSERLEQVYKGLGEMQTLAVGVGDLKKVLSNVKTRGVLGEIQLGTILEQVLTPAQYRHNVITKPGSQKTVEYAVILPGDGENSIYMPIDAKFPADLYTRLLDAYDSGDNDLIRTASLALANKLKQCAKEIKEKYIYPPNTTDFAIMFLPFEGLYAEALRLNIAEEIMQDYKVSIAGPSTMAALLNSLHMGFRTLALQKHSGEVWNVLGGVRTEFEKFGEVLASAQKKIEDANSEIDKLVGVRTRAIQRKLKTVSLLPDEETEKIFDEDEI